VVCASHREGFYHLLVHIHLETARLAIRRFTVADAGNLVRLNSDPEVMRYIPGRPPGWEEIRTGLTAVPALRAAVSGRSRFLRRGGSPLRSLPLQPAEHGQRREV
jgi:RimJ/RimL family protein N-acetyltransferase